MTWTCEWTQSRTQPLFQLQQRAQTPVCVARSVTLFIQDLSAMLPSNSTIIVMRKQTTHIMNDYMQLANGNHMFPKNCPSQ